MRFNKGDIILNGWSNEGSKYRYLLVTSYNKDRVYGFPIDIANKSVSLEKTYLSLNVGKRFEGHAIEEVIKVVGYIDLFEVISNKIDYEIRMEL